MSDKEEIIAALRRRGIYAHDVSNFQGKTDVTEAWGMIGPGKRRLQANPASISFAAGARTRAPGRVTAFRMADQPNETKLEAHTASGSSVDTAISGRTLHKRTGARDSGSAVGVQQALQRLIGQITPHGLRGMATLKKLLRAACAERTRLMSMASFKVTFFRANCSFAPLGRLLPSRFEARRICASSIIRSFPCTLVLWLKPSSAATSVSLWHPIHLSHHLSTSQIRCRARQAVFAPAVTPLLERVSLGCSTRLRKRFHGS